MSAVIRKSPVQIFSREDLCPASASQLSAKVHPKPLKALYWEGCPAPLAPSDGGFFFCCSPESWSWGEELEHHEAEFPISNLGTEQLPRFPPLFCRFAGGCPSNCSGVFIWAPGASWGSAVPRAIPVWHPEVCRASIPASQHHLSTSGVFSPLFLTKLLWKYSDFTGGECRGRGIFCVAQKAGNKRGDSQFPSSGI